MKIPNVFKLTEFNYFLRSFNQREINEEMIAGVVNHCALLLPMVDVTMYKPKNLYNIVVTNKRLLFIPAYDLELTQYYRNNKTISIDSQKNIGGSILSNLFGKSEGNYWYLPYYGTLAYFKTENVGEAVIYINRRKSHSFEVLSQASIGIQGDKDEIDNLISFMKSNHLYAYRYLDSTGKHMYDYRGQLDKLWED